MEAIGRLSAGVAHDFNNILQSIVGGLELALDDVAEETSAYEFMRIAINSALRGASLTHHLLSYARQQILRPHTIEVRPFLAEVEVLLARTLGPHVVVRMSASPETSVLADAGQLETAILNLAINASHAMPQGGLLTMHARTVYEPEGAWVLIEVTDTGSGMDEATLAQATEPFFTTKGLGGSGLGLSMVHGFAEQSGGRMTIVSALGQGTTIALRLPSIAAIKHEEQPEPAARPAIGGRILVVDDAPDVLITTGAFLEKSGFTVVRAENGDRALALIAQSEHFDALVTDYAMPGLNGADLIIEARLIRPELKALIITGYTIGKHPVTLSTDIPVLNKPFKRADLIEAIHQLIDGEPAPVDEAAVLTQSHEA
jgi:CheY-like chemotaxis protein